LAREICILDTSVLCELIEVPNLCHDREEVLEEMAAKVKRSENLLLPMTAILETGNHIGQNGNGGQRRAAAVRFVGTVQDALDGRAPFVPIQFPESPELAGWLREFPRWVLQAGARGKGSGLGDLALVQEWERQRQLNRSRRVYIWSLDRHLAGYDSGQAQEK
jgi:hypothetical protein